MASSLLPVLGIYPPMINVKVVGGLSDGTEMGGFEV
jgi:hypothetical protein